MPPKTIKTIEIQKLDPIRKRSRLECYIVEDWLQRQPVVIIQILNALTQYSYLFSGIN